MADKASKTRKSVKPTNVQLQVIRQLFADVSNFEGAGEALQRTLRQFKTQFGNKRSEPMMLAIATVMRKKYPGAVITVGQFAKKWNVKFDVKGKGKKASNTARVWYNRNILPLLPALSTSGKTRAENAAKTKRDPAKRAEDGILSAAKAIRKAHKTFGLTRAQVLKALKLAFSRAKLA